MYDTLILSSGGTRGYATLGALVWLDDLGYLQSIKHHVGCSVGSLIAMALNIGMSTSDVTRIFFRTDFKKLQNPSVINLFEYGLDRGLGMESKIKETLVRAGLPPNITLRELFNVTGKTLAMGAVDVGCRKFVLLDHTTYPDATVVSCVRASISIPFVYTPVTIDQSTFVDGALLNHMPIVPWMERYPDSRVLGVELCITKPCAGPLVAKGMADYALHIMECFSAQEARHSYASDQCTILKVETPSELSWIVSPDEVQKRRLFVIGYEVAKTRFHSTIDSVGVDSCTERQDTSAPSPNPTPEVLTECEVVEQGTPQAPDRAA